MCNNGAPPGGTGFEQGHPFSKNGWGFPQSMEKTSIFHPNSPFARSTVDLLNVTFIISAVIMALVTGLIVYSIWRFRGHPDHPEPPQVRGHKQLEIVWTVIPFLVLVCLFILTIRSMYASDPPSRRDPDIIVVGHQFWWEVRYPKSGVLTANEIHIPTGRPLLFRLESADVIHDFWVGQLGRKVDLMPEYANFIWLQADQPKEYYGACSEFCGTQHAWMRLNIVAPTNGFQVVEGGNNTYTVALNSQPTANVTISITSGDTAQGGTPSPSSLTFTPGNWNTPQTVSFAGANDLILDGNTTWRLTNSVTSSDTVYAALAPVVLAMTTLDNEATVTLPSGDLRYGISQSGVGIDGRAAISDPNTLNYASATLTVALTANGTADDRLEIRNDGTDAGQISVSGGTISYGGTAIATFTGGTGTTPLVATFNAVADATAAQALLRNITYRNVNSNPARNRRTVSVTLTHSDSGTGSATTGISFGLVRFADFQQDADHGYGAYTNAADIELFQLQPDVPQPRGHATDTNNPQMWLDYRDPDSPNQSEALLRFDNIVGNGPGQIPSNAIIVSAELLLNIRDAGDGSPLYRMLIPWDATNTTWNSMGNGIQPNDFQARSTFDSAFGVPAVSGDSGIGVINIGVTADVQAWVNGTDNYGWGMTGWNSEINPTWGNGTDGLGFRCCESPNIEDRPRLRVLWLPADSVSTASFRQNVNDYTNAADTRIRQSTPDASATTATAVFVDWDVVSSNTLNPDDVLIRFDQIIGTNPGQVPPGAVVEAAMLDLATVSGSGYGDGGQFFAMLTPWLDTDTWNSLNNGIQADGVKAASTPTASAGSPTLNPNVCGGYMSFEVTPDAQAWVSGIRPNYGWAILPWDGGGDGWAISMSESTNERERPQLRVYYTAAVAPLRILSLQRGATTVTLKFSGVIGNSYSVLRAPAVTGPYSSIGSVTVQPDGTATSVDNAPLAGQAFYRISAP